MHCYQELGGILSAKECARALHASSQGIGSIMLHVGLFRVLFVAHRKHQGLANSGLDPRRDGNMLFKKCLIHIICNIINITL